MMILTRIAAVFALATLGACSSLPVGRDFSKLTMGEQLDYYTCVFSDVGSSMTSGGSAGAMLDNMLSKSGNIQETTRNAANLCAVKQFINPNTIPGLR